jgi:NAD-dependent deacetylase
MRPAVVLFDEPLSVDAEWESQKCLRDCDLFLAVGTSGTVSPASNFVRAAEYAGARTLYVNLEPMTPHNPAFRELLLGRAEEILPKLLGDGRTD